VSDHPTSGGGMPVPAHHCIKPDSFKEPLLSGKRFTRIGNFKQPFFCADQYRRTGELSIVFLVGREHAMEAEQCLPSPARSADCYEPGFFRLLDLTYDTGSG
jgi:hypothetical protein